MITIKAYDCTHCPIFEHCTEHNEQHFGAERPYFSLLCNKVDFLDEDVRPEKVEMCVDLKVLGYEKLEAFYTDQGYTRIATIKLPNKSHRTNSSNAYPREVNIPDWIEKNRNKGTDEIKIFPYQKNAVDFILRRIY